jgi:hypothetical protein
MGKILINLLLLAVLAAGGCAGSARTGQAPAPDYRPIPVTEVRQVQIPEGLLARSQFSGPRYSGNDVAPSYVSAPSGGGYGVAGGGSGRTSQDSDASQYSSAIAAAALGRSPQVYEAAVGPPILPPIVIGGGVVAYNPTISAIPVGAGLDVQAWTSHDLRYVQMNLRLQNVGVPTFRTVNIGFGF